MKILGTLVCLIFVNAATLFSQTEKQLLNPDFKHSIETSPLSPLLQMADKGIWGIKYEYALTPHDELKVGIAYMNIHFDEGNTNSPGLILGYRRYLWKKLYAEYELWPCYDAFYEKNEDAYYPKFTSVSVRQGLFNGFMSIFVL